MQKNVLITGAAKRIGAACARLLHDEGCNVFLHYRSSKQAALELCNELNQIRPDSAYMMQADLLHMEELEALVSEACMAWVADVTEQQWNELMGSNLKAPFFLTKLLSETLVNNRGCIINIVDIHAERGLMGYPVYCIAKAGLVAMTKILAKEFGPVVRVNGVAPGAILWPDNNLSEQERHEILQRVALKRSGEPADIAKAVWFLINDAEYMTGQILTVDGGRTLFC